MDGTREGGQKAAETVKQEKGDDFHQKIGQQGGSKTGGSQQSGQSGSQNQGGSQSKSNKDQNR